MKPKSLQINDEIELRIERLAVGGMGISHTQDGLVVFIPRVAPDERVRVKIRALHKNFAESELIKILEPSPFRRAPPCEVADICGGCQWQHIVESEQLHQKLQIVESTLKKFISKMTDLPKIEIFEGSRKFAYRNRVQPKLKGKKFGFYARDSHDIVETDKCWIAEDEINLKWQDARDWALENSKDSVNNLNESFNLEIRSDAEKNVSFDRLSDIGPAFSQVNREMNSKLIEQTLIYLDEPISEATRIVELYAGAGNFTFEMAQRFAKLPIVAVELSEKLVKFADQKVKEMKLSKRLDFRLSDVEAFLKRFNIQNSDLIVLDPPRGGSSEFIMKVLAEHAPKAILYISCHPVSLARDLKWFFESSKTKYQVQKLGIFDMFPQTDHIETLVLLQALRSHQ